MELPDRLVTEEPMEIRLAGPGDAAVKPLSVTMRTPGNDFELAVGFLVSEGVVEHPGDVVAVRYCEPSEHEAQSYNIVTVHLARAARLAGPQRAFAVNSSCGVCGTSTLEQIRDRCPQVRPGPVVKASMLVGLPDRLRGAQELFDQTGGLHAAGLFRADGGLARVREDIGRHNAVDKLVGRSALDGDLPLSGHLMVVSGRVSFEIVQKAAVAGVPLLAAVSAPSSLAVETARMVGMTVIGFVRGDRANVYTCPERVDMDG